MKKRQILRSRPLTYAVMVVLIAIYCVLPFNSAVVHAAPAVFTVNTEADGSDANTADGICETVNANECTLRAAIEQANANANPADLDVIEFDIPGAGVHELQPTGALDVISEPLFIDGSTQGEVDCLNHSLLIEINGTNFPAGSRNLYFVGDSAGSGIHAIATTGAQPGPGPIFAAGAGVKFVTDNGSVTCSNIGVKADGVTAGQNNLGVVSAASGLTVGGPTPGDGNLIANMGQFGIHLQYDNLQHPVDPTGILVQNNTFRNNTMNSIAASNSDNITIMDNTLDGTVTSAGITIDNAIGVTITNNTVSNSPTGITAWQSDDISIEDNVAEDNQNGINVNDATNITIRRNTASSNTANGITVADADNVIIEANTAEVNNNGMSVSGSTTVDVFDNVVSSNVSSGIALDSNTSLDLHNNRLVSNTGGATGLNINGGTSNTIRSNVAGLNGVGVAAQGTMTDVAITGNFIGVDSDGTLMGNSTSGLQLFGVTASNVVIGGTVGSDKNIISGNQNGVVAVMSNGLQLKGNYIGTNASGAVQSGYGNNGLGMYVLASENLTIGGTSAASKNIIAGNSYGGISVVSQSANTVDANGNSILGNSIFDNTDNSGIGIDLADDSNGDYSSDTEVGVTANDLNDPDQGANYYLNKPVISDIVASGAQVAITYSLDIDVTEDNASGYRVEFFANDPAYSSGAVEGQRFVGSDQISGDVTDRTVVLDTSALPVNTYAFTATTTVANNSATGFGSTSEFSDAIVASVANQVSPPSTSSGSGSSIGILPRVGQVGGAVAGIALLAAVIVFVVVSRRRRHRDRQAAS